jgi:predicted O-linked N-acetylglucosamine transferase (SPINDLY family)
MQLCDWSNFDAEREHLIAAVEADRPASQPLVLLAIPSSAEQQLQCAKAWIARQHPSAPNPVWRGERYGHQRIRIAYLSGDFRQHAISHLIAGLFECHDRSRFEITALSSGPVDSSDLRRRIVASVDRFIDIRSHTDEQVAELVRSSEIDVLIDVLGFTQYARTNVFARRPAPVQINYLGYPGTMGAPYFDYIVADPVLIAEQHKRFYSEKIVLLPHTYQANDAKRSIPKKHFSRGELGLPPTGVVFCCFNNCYKILPHVFDSWMRILKRVDQSVLWLLEENPTAPMNLRREAADRGVSPDRLLFAKPLPHEEHMARLRIADLMLDTAPYNAHTTGSDALWAGVPIVTRIGETFAGRVAASLLKAIGVPELVTSTVQAYEALAIELAENPVRLAEIKKTLAGHRLTTPLFDTARYTRHIEAAYIVMVERYRARLAPADISVPERP